MKSSKEIRQEFIEFFREKSHHFVRSAPVVPLDDPTLLFANAGMNQFKDVFLNTGTRPYVRAANSQKCIRASGKHNDLEDVGRDNFHHTFFEMLGNWSFGDYFKAEAVEWAWELLVKRWGLPPDKLYATVFGGDPGDGLGADEEAEKLWREKTPLPPQRIMRFGKKSNFWEMGDQGPCGPCTEIHMDMGEGTCPLEGKPGHSCQVNTDGCWRFVEIWNLVFIQYNRGPDGKLSPLAARHVDTGMGFERVVRVLQGVQSNYETDLFTPLMAGISRETGKKMSPGETAVAFQVIADHLRALSFAIADGALPSNEGRGYVLRRILRRAARFGRVLDMHQPFIHKLVPDLVGVMGEAFPELPAQAQHVQRVIQAEEESFGQTLDRGLERFETILQELAKKKGKVIPGEETFKLYDTYGFPVDLTRLMAEERGLGVDEAEFQRRMEQQRETARAAGSAQTGQVEWQEVTPGNHSAFVGYTRLETPAVIRRSAPGPDGTTLLVLDQTPFYAEGGGQVGDQGVLEGPQGRWKVEDTRRDGDLVVHICRPEGKAAPGPQPLTARVEDHRRADTARNHTATHLLQAALKQVLGQHVNQAGSVVQPDQLRFDFTHFEKPSAQQLEDIARLVNREIRRNTPMTIFETGYDDAVGQGVTALFGEKYGDRVRVVKAGDFSAELCGGCHAAATGEIGLFAITGESAVASGVRRITAVTGRQAEEEARKAFHLVERFRQALNAQPDDLEARLASLLEERKGLERDVKALRKEAMGGGVDGLLAGAVEAGGVRVVAAQTEAASMEDLRSLADQLRKKLPGGVVVLAAVIEGKGTLLCAVGEDLVKKKAKAADLVNKIAALAGGKGGGPPHMATAGAKEPDKLSLAVKQAPRLTEEYLKSIG
ncbi:MAG: alanine--tRNA ligase [Deltaproteobacteria bacterium]|nr:alanine--tRNA ligase [Deltaproteobacteria bacterium]